MNDLYQIKLYEKGKLRDRFRDRLTLAVYIIIVAVISILVMNLLVYPTTVFAVNYKKAFNIITIIIMIGIAAGLPAILGTLWCLRLRKEGISGVDIVKLLLRRVLNFLAIGLFSLLLGILTIYLISLFFSKNHYWLYKLTSS